MCTVTQPEPPSPGPSCSTPLKIGFFAKKYFCKNNLKPQVGTMILWLLAAVMLGAGGQAGEEAECQCEAAWDYVEVLEGPV